MTHLRARLIERVITFMNKGLTYPVPIKRYVAPVIVLPFSFALAKGGTKLAWWPIPVLRRFSLLRMPRMLLRNLRYLE